MNSAFCRLCLKSDCWNSPVPIFENPSLPCKLKDLLQIQLSPVDSLPKVICHLCLAKFTFLVEFHKQVNSSNNLLNSLVGDKEVVAAAEYQKDDDVSRIPVSKPLLSTSSTPKAKVIPQQVAQVKPATTQVKKVKSQLHHSVVRKQKSVKGRKGGRPPAGQMNVNLFNCTRCRYSTRNAQLFEAHKNKKFECRVCHLYFCSLKGMKIHESKHKFNNRFEKNMNETSNLVTNNYNEQADNDNNGAGEKNDDSENSDGSAVNKANSGGNKTDPIYSWCQPCNKVYVNGADFLKHKEEYHNFPVKNETNELAVTEGNSVLSSNLERDSLASNVKLPKKRGRPFGSKRKDSSVSDSEDLSSKRVKKNADFTCWKCKGVFNSRSELFIHPCIYPKESSSEPTDGNNSFNISASDDVVVIDQGTNKQVPQVISDDEDYDENCNQESDDQELNDSEEIQYIKNHLSSKKDKPTKTQSIYTTDESDPENCHENVDGKTDVSDHGSERSEVGCSEEEREIPLNGGDIVSDSSYVSKIRDTKTPVNESPDSSNKSGTLKRCNECGEMFQSLKELFHHKRSHRIETSEL